ncbi:phage baseplate assembly protein V [Burkholderia ubonensis]|uniref:phage baseplate assembly protein V n=1 Tax=Burkholderia ubonensis TaxID=101571 RepID=UPI0009B3E31D|nr:phage baseplate assembly protein V [Burkholderia ubonensis]
MDTLSSQTLESRCDITLFLGGQVLQTLKLLYLKTEQRVNGIPSATLVLSVPGNAQQALGTSQEVAECQPGALMSISVDDEVLHKRVELFSGVITGCSLTLSQGQAELLLTLKHSLSQLDNVIRSQVFMDKTDGEIIRALCPASVAEIRNQAGMNIRHEQRVQFRCSDWRMLRHCLDACGAWLIAEPSVVHIIQPTLSARPDHNLQAQNGPLMERARWQFSAVDQPANLKLMAWDIDAQSLVSASARQATLGSGALDPGKGKRLNQTPWVLGYGTSPSAEALRCQADSLLLNLQLNRVQGEFRVQGTAKYRPGQTLKLSGFGQDLDGTGMMTAVTHTIVPSRWTTSLTIGDRGLAPAATPLPQVSGLLPGIVAEYDQDDPKNFYRLLIHLNVLDSDNNKNQLWARFAMPYATKGSSFICYPEPGDEVVVGFFEDNPNYPVIVGALHNPKKPPAVKPGEDNGLKGWRTDELRLQIDTRQNNLSLQAGGGSEVTLDKSKALIIKCSNGITLEGKQGVIIKSNKIDLTK